MFEGRAYRQTGHGLRTIRFADVDGGVATTTYSYKLTAEEREVMARRITAALNLVRNMTIEQIEWIAALAPPRKYTNVEVVAATSQLTRCAAARDGECSHPQCPQTLDGEPVRSGRHCPIDSWGDDD